MERILENDIQPLACIYNQSGRVEVWKVNEIRTSRKLCMKKLFVNDINEATDIQRECIAMATLNHPHIVPIISACLGGRNKQITHILIFTEFYEQGDLQQLTKSKIQQRNYFTEEVLLGYLGQLVDAFSYMQDLEIAHRDVKPQNIFVCENGRSLKIGDLGSASKKGTAGDFSGTPLYLSPKLRKAYVNGFYMFGTNDDSFKSDVYSLGLTFLYMASLKELNDLVTLENLENKIYSRLNEIQNNYPNLTAILQMMLEVHEENRLDFHSLKKKLALISTDATQRYIIGAMATQTIKRLENLKVQPLNAKCSVCGNINKDEDQYLYNSGIVCKRCAEEFNKTCFNRNL